MRIGIDVRLWNQTGVGRYIRNLVYNLEKIDRTNSYVLFARDEDKVKVKSRNFEIVSANIKWHSISEQSNFIKIIDKEKVDLVHFPYYSIPVLYKKPFIVTIHDLIPLHFKTGNASTLPFPIFKLKFIGYKLVVSQAAKNAKKIIAPSNFSKDEIVKLLNVSSSKVEVVYEGTDEFLLNSQPSEKKEHFLYIGNAYPHKNLDLLIHVFKKLPDIKLVLVGKEDYFYKRLKNKAAKISNIKFFGYATDAQLKDLYKKSRALIIPSFIEGFGLPALEAMANRCLVLASDILVLHEVCGNVAFYFDPGNSEDLKNLIVKIHSDTAQYQNKIEVGLKRVKEFSWKKTAEQTLKLYEQSLKIDSA